MTDEELLRMKLSAVNAIGDLSLAFNDGKIDRNLWPELEAALYGISLYADCARDKVKRAIDSQAAMLEAAE